MFVLENKEVRHQGVLRAGKGVRAQQTEYKTALIQSAHLASRLTGIFYFKYIFQTSLTSGSRKKNVLEISICDSKETGFFVGKRKCFFRKRRLFLKGYLMDGKINSAKRRK